MPHQTHDTSATVPRDDDAAGAFVAAERALFHAVGLDTRSRFVELDAPDCTTRVVEVGAVPDPGSAGTDPPLVFVHGTAEFAGFLAPLMARLDDCHLVAYDRPGYGRSSPFSYTAGNVRQAVVDSLRGVLDDLGIERCDLVGHSWGSNGSVRFALRHPGRVRRLFLVGSVPGFPGTSPPAPMRAMTTPLVGRLVRRLQKPGEAGVHDLAAVFGERDVIEDHPAFVRAIAAHEADPVTARAGRTEFGALISTRGWRPPTVLDLADLRRLEVPTAIVWGDHDTLGLPADVRDAVDAIPDARFEVVDAGHIPFLAQADRCAELVREARATTGTEPRR